MPYLDIVLFAAIAAFVLVRLWLVLGRRNDDEPERPNPFMLNGRPEKDDEDAVVLPRPGTPPETRGLTTAGHAAASLAGVLDQLTLLDPEFSEKNFLQGARAAFVQIVEHFARGSLDAISSLLTPAVAAQFAEAVRRRKAAGETIAVRVDSIRSAEVTDARLEGTRAFLTVSFSSVQSQTSGGAEQKAAAGAIDDTWTFTRDMMSDDPNWQLAETRS